MAKFGARLAEGLVIRVIRFPGRYKKPRAHPTTMDSLPRNAANKVLRQNLREAINVERATGKADRFQLVEG